MKTKLNQFKKELKKIFLEEYKPSYEYKYLKYNPDTNCFCIDENYIKNYGKNRNGYEDFKNNNKHLRIEYSGKKYFREVRDNKNNLIGAFIEEIKYGNNCSKEKELVEMLFEKLCNVFNVKDKKNLKNFINYKMSINPLNLKEKYIILFINVLEDIIEDYENSKEFQQFFNKLIK